MNLAACLPHLIGLRIVAVYQHEQRLHPVVSSIAHSSSCPLYRPRSTRLQSRYERTVSDLPWGGVPVVIHLAVRRFVCATSTCPRQIFAERFPALAAPRARQTVPADVACQQLGLALGGQTGARLAALLGLATSRATVVRRVLATRLTEAERPHVLGIDDRPWRRGRRCGTILVDLARRSFATLC
jgi:transposase